MLGLTPFIIRLNEGNLELTELRSMIDSIRGTHSTSSSDFKYLAATQVLRFFLGEDWYSRCILRQEKPENGDPWLLNNAVSHADFQIRNARVAVLAEALFDLKDCVGFGALVRRFQNRTDDTKACFLEACAANTIISKEGSISIDAESGTKKEDFDFTVKFEGGTVNVEVTSKSVSNITEGNFLAALRRKHSQLPDDNASIIFIYLSQSQLDSSTTSNSINNAIRSFFQKNRRVNFVVLFSDYIIETAEGGFLSTICVAERAHPSPRYPLSSSILSGSLKLEIRLDAMKELVRADAAAAVEYAREASNGQNYSFIEWYCGRGLSYPGFEARPPS